MLCRFYFDTICSVLGKKATSSCGQNKATTSGSG